MRKIEDKELESLLFTADNGSKFIGFEGTHQPCSIDTGSRIKSMLPIFIKGDCTTDTTYQGNYEYSGACNEEGVLVDS
jgi:hypothetical protein